MHSFAEWLRAVGLERYGAVFAENGIDFDVVRDLTDEEVRAPALMLGDRRRLQQVVAVICAALRQDPAPSFRSSFGR